MFTLGLVPTIISLWALHNRLHLYSATLSGQDPGELIVATDHAPNIKQREGAAWARLGVPAVLIPGLAAGCPAWRFAAPWPLVPSPCYLAFGIHSLGTPFWLPFCFKIPE